MVPVPLEPFDRFKYIKQNRNSGNLLTRARMVPVPLEPRHGTKKVHFSLNLFEDFLYYKYTTKIWQNTMESEVKEKDL